MCVFVGVCECVRGSLCVYVNVRVVEWGGWVGGCQ
jgi:hypothetical protein